MAIIVLRDIPRHRVQLDRVVYPVGSGFRGFQNVLPGFHIVQVFRSDEATPLQAEIVLANSSSIAVLAAAEQHLIVDHSVDGEGMAALARSGILSRSLVDAMAGQTHEVALWHAITSELETPLSELPPSLAGYAQTQGLSRFERFWLEHAGDVHSAMRTLQAAFIQAIFYQDGEATARLRELLQGHYHAGERGVQLAADYFPLFADWLSAVATWVPELFRRSSAAQEGIHSLVEDLHEIGSSSENLALKSAAAQLAEAVESVDESSHQSKTPKESLS